VAAEASAEVFEPVEAAALSAAPAEPFAPVEAAAQSAVPSEPSVPVEAAVPPAVSAEFAEAAEVSEEESSSWAVELELALRLQHYHLF